MAQPIKMYYLTPVFRYEKPQTGRLREHHQFGIEVLAPEASVDAEIIILAMTLFSRLNIKGLELRINSIGCPACRPRYHTVLKEYLAGHLDEMCSNCKQRFERNPCVPGLQGVRTAKESLERLLYWIISATSANSILMSCSST